MPLWIQDGSLLIDADGNVIECDTCPCDAATPAEPIRPDCCAGGYPTTLFATFSVAAGCACADGATITLAWNGSAWVGTTTICGALWSAKLWIPDGGCTFSWEINMEAGACGDPAWSGGGQTSCPLDIDDTRVQFGSSGNCGCATAGEVNLTVNFHP